MSHGQARANPLLYAVMARTPILAVVGVVLAAAVAWNAAEAHYQSCIAAADAIPDTRSGLDREYPDRAAADPYVATVQRRLDGCSRMP